jgi:magnesium transporter
MDVRFVSDDGIQQHPVEELERLLARDDGLVWVDIPVGDQQATRVLSEVFDFHPLAIQACIERNAVPKVRAYRDHIFVILHAPELGTGGHVHYVELDQFIGPRYLVTVHGPVNPAVTPRPRSARPARCWGASRPAGCVPAPPSSCPMRSSRPWRRARRRSWRP